MATSPVKDFLVTYLMPEKCYEEIFVNFHMHVPCLKFVLNKAAGLWILLDSFLGADGLSLPAVLLQLYAFSCPVVFAMVNHFPLFAWAERLFTLAQIAAIVVLILYHRADARAGLLFLLAYGGAMFLLGSYAAAAIVSVMQDSSLAALIASKVFQAAANYSNGHTGQLSTLSVLLAWAGSLSVVFVSLSDTGSSLAALLHILSACLSCVLVAQILCYRSSSTKQKKE
ncbi:hypothetical protein INR49_015591 [Caranx melampygus]|nr:hypothetical protein INR49_015591 [Caranx melampygus]